MGRSRLDERRTLIRQVRQRLESLGRAEVGLRIPAVGEADRIAGRPPQPAPPQAARPAGGDRQPVRRSNRPAPTGSEPAARLRRRYSTESGFETPPVPAADRPAILAAAP